MKWLRLGAQTSSFLDVVFSTFFALISIKEPKSRFTYARHQSTKIGQKIWLTFWTWLLEMYLLMKNSGVTVRRLSGNTFKSLLSALTLQTLERAR